VKIPRTQAAFTPILWSTDTTYCTTEVVDQDYPTHSKVLDHMGQPFQYEDRQPMGFDLRRKS